MKEAMFYRKLGKMKVQCELCPNNCVILHGHRGVCGVRENREGKLYSIVYGLPCTTAVDPIEKKPLYHFLPGTRTFSMSTAGCNLKCKFCQNWNISQKQPEEIRSYRMTPEEAVDAALKTGCESIAYTYVEPSIFYEYMLDTAKLAHSAGLKNVMVTNGYINTAPLKRLCEHIDAANVDLKGFTEEYYRDICAGKLKPVLDTIKTMKKEGVFVELTTLIVPGHNDSTEMLKKEFAWVAKEAGKDTPLHLSRFYPHYKMMHVPATMPETLLNAFALAKKAGLKHVYVGNIDIEDSSDTFCAKCGKRLITREGFDVVSNKVKDGKCFSCGAKIAGVWNNK